MTFEEFLQGLSDDNERDAVRARWEPCAEKLDENGAQRQFVFNFDAEPRLPEAAWQSIKQAIMAGNLDAPSLQRALTSHAVLTPLRATPFLHRRLRR